VGRAPGQRYRIEQWAPFLAEEGINTDFLPFADAKLAELLYERGQFTAKSMGMAAAFIRRLGQLRLIRRYDVILIHRTACLAGPALVERMVAMLRRPVIYDFDDSIFLLHTTGTNRRFGWLKFPGKTASICKLSAHVVVGNSYLADYSRKYNRRVTVIPTGIDTTRYQPADNKNRGGRAVIGWTGTSTSQTYLEMFAPVLRDLVARRDVELRVISDRKPLLPAVPHVWRRWSADNETEDLGALDIGIMPMPDDSWSRGKCSLKALQYMAMGLPAVCSDVGANREVINHGENGFLAATAEEWLKYIGILIDDPALCARLGCAARKTVEDRYSMRHCARLLADTVRQTVQGEKQSGLFVNEPLAFYLSAAPGQGARRSTRSVQRPELRNPK
jgi:glycosyltransferase involved in cell wall biosynthesis